MDSAYDRKFEEMKKYIPFLESMITRLENTSTGPSNPRQAQLDKIRSLRDLLLDKKKRMKMDNLLKCEQVLINLYAKVEQRADTLPGIQPASEVIGPKDKVDLNLARQKLKIVASKSLDPDTLPEIARASETEVVCSPGSKEPALFQRRPNKNSLSPTRNSSTDKSPQKSSSRRNYTRVLVSPDRSDRLWSPSDGSQSDHVRRSPTRPSRRYSPSYQKRDRKKTSRQESHTTRESGNFNITLKIPEERLNSLNTKDILSRIINCSDGDVDIATLRELRTQIRRELKQTGANEDISDLILKSYKNKNNKSKAKNKNDVEEGELSDSESEAIENIYGNLVVVEKDKNKDVSGNQSNSTKQDLVSRKIQICLVANSDKEETSPESSKNKNTKDSPKICDETDFEMFDDNNPKPASSANKDVTDKEHASSKTKTLSSLVKTNKTNPNDVITIEDVGNEKEDTITKSNCSGVIDMNSFDLQDNSNSTLVTGVPQNIQESNPVPFTVNFYKPIDSDPTETTKSHNNEEHTNKSVDQLGPLDKVLDKPKETELMDPETDNNKPGADPQLISKDKSTEITAKSSETSKSSANGEDTNKISSTSNDSPESMPSQKDPEIPLLNEPTVQTAKKDIVSEIDILQALKNEILSETIAIPGADVSTPALHQPKLTKVANAQELPKKRISIENYKRKSKSSNKLPLFVKSPGNALSKKESMKQSLKLTEKEVERFSLMSKIALADSSDDEKDMELKSPDDSTDLAPKSPDIDITNNIVSPPVIIPADPVKTVIASSVSDVDMRTLPIMSPNPMSPFVPAIVNQPRSDVNPDVRKSEVKRLVAPIDPRVRKNPLLPSPVVAYPNITPSRNPNIAPNMTPSRAPNMTPSRAPNMTPSRAPNMTPNARSFEVTPSRPFEADDNPVRKHVYAPMFGNIQDNHGERKSAWEPSERSPVDTSNWEMSNVEREKSTSRWDDRNSSNNFSQRDDGPRSRYNDSNYDTNYNRSRTDRNSRDDYNRQDGPHTSNYYSRSDCPATPTPSFGRGDAPSTPSHYFGRSECPRTPSHPFGRSESNQSIGRSEPPLTPSHPFGRTEAPMTPSHPFGRSEAPMTPNHPFGRSEAPMTPSHPFGRSEAPLTPSHPFGRSDYSYTNPSPKYGKPQDPRLNRNYDHDTNNRRDSGSYNDRYRYNRNDPRNFNREPSIPRNEPKPYTPDQTYNREHMLRRESSVGRSMPKDDRDHMYSRDRNRDSDNSRSYAEEGSRRSFQREPSATRSFQRESSTSRSFQREPSATHIIPDHRARASSVGRSIRRENSNELSVESHAGRAFSINTSVNSTFQKFLDSHRSHDSSFDARRQRASSVGRSLTREPSMGPAQPPVSSHKFEDTNRDRFRRAQSVGRDLSNSSRVEKSFKDVKAEFESYRSTERKKHTLPTKPNHNINSRDPRIRRESIDNKQDKTHNLNKTHVSVPSIPPKKFNYRDPRQRKEDKKMKEKSKYEHNRKRSDSRDRHSYGISSESVSKPPVISSVKNYKIPKIKRAPEEKPVEPVVEAVPTKNKEKSSAKTGSKDPKQKPMPSQTKIDKKVKNEKKVVTDKISDKKEEKEKYELPNQNSEKRVTRRSGKRNEESQSSLLSEDDEVIITRTRKFKKVIHESDSDDTETKNTSETTSPKKTSLGKNKSKATQSDKKDSDTNLVQEASNKDIEPEDSQDTLDNSFGLDDLELFPDNIITDPVLDNINALIADLDNDLATPKDGTTCNDLFNDITIENMLEKITSSPVKPENKKTDVESPTTITETVKKDLFDTLVKGTQPDPDQTNPTEHDKSVTATTDDKNTNVTDSAADAIEDKTELVNDPQSKTISQTDDKNDLEPVVSTSVNEEEFSKKDQSVDSEKNLDGRSTPDSTNDAVIAIKNAFEMTGENPDSTIEKQCEMNSDISSTHDSGDKAAKESPVPKEAPSQIDSIGSLLSILQDKSKIKELLSMLGDQTGENEKIKKKLEKLSEIVSDDEDTNEAKNDTKPEETAKIETSLEEKVETKPDKEDGKEELQTQPSAGDVNMKQSETTSDKPVENEFDKLTDDPNVTTEDEKKDLEVTNKTKDDKVEEINQVANEITENTVESGETNNSPEIIEEPGKEEVLSNDVDNDDNSEPEGDTEVDHGKKLNFVKPEKKIVKKIPKRLKFKKGKAGKRLAGEEKRVTRSEAAISTTKPGRKIANRELKQLHESLKEMFMSDDILNASGVRMCRLAKMVTDKSKEDAPISESKPVVLLEKVKHIEGKNLATEMPMRKKPGPKPKMKPALTNSDDKQDTEDDKPLIKYRPGPKSKTKLMPIDKDPYEFETESLNESKSSEKAADNSSDSESESLASSKSFGSTELLVELKKKPKRKRGGWKAGVIKPKNKKRKIEVKSSETPPRKPTPEPEREFTIPDFNCYTDKNYCFSKNLSNYSCRLCESTHSGADIVFHYKKHHPHSEIPLSRMSPEIAREAIEQCGDIDFRAISKIPTDKYTCRFCFKEFAKKRAVLEAFFWHVVSMHTGEYKQLCSECINVTRCPFNLDIPPPPKDIKGQLIGYICGKCNFTQISLENLKTHVIVRHNDKETEVYTINFAVMTRKTISSLVKRCSLESAPRPTRSTRSNQSYTEASDDRSEITESEPETGRSDKNPDKEVAETSRNFSFKSKITFENEDNASDMSNIANTESSSVKVEQEEVDDDDRQQDTQDDEPFNEDPGAKEAETEVTQTVDQNQAASNDIMDYPHFKISYTNSGNKEYVCCINGNDNHYKTGLLISMKKHVQLKHSEIWDGYCFVCKVIVTSQGQHQFTECLTHYLDKHIDNFPIFEKVSEPIEKSVTPVPSPEPTERVATPTSYINVRPLAELLVKSVDVPPVLPVIENVVSLVPPIVESPKPSPTYPVTRKEAEPPKEYKYEEAQAEVMSKKHRVVLDAMMTPDKLIQVFKCAGRFCSFTTDSAEDALLHASTHQRVGGTNALLCTYCDFDSSGNSIDLVSHVFTHHGRSHFVCGMCFYRAAASQLVGAHITRVHGVTPEEGRVLKSTNTVALPETTEGLLSRETAVPLYICKQGTSEQPCTFRTVTHTKFWEHLMQKHEDACGFNCYMCSTTHSDATSLVVHLKSHGLRLYHCTLCVCGADSEPALLAHVAARHPHRAPRAFIRTVCGSSGNGSFKILPLVELKKNAPTPEEVKPKNVTENPVREAERSLELEKLIGHMLDTEVSKEPEKEPEPESTISEIPVDSNIVDEAISNLLEESPAMATLIPVPSLVPQHSPPRAVTPAPPETLAKAVTPVLKEEPPDTTPEKNDDVICLDSDDEDSKHGIITLSDDETRPEPAVTPSSGPLLTKKPGNLYKCKKCGTVTKTFQGFKKHMYACFKPGDRIQCAHCQFSVDKVSVYLNHFGVAHNATPKYNCGVCSHVEPNMYQIKKHLKSHNVGRITVTSKSDENGDIHYVVDGKVDTPVKAKPVKRKSSGSTAITPAKIKRYGPSDVDKLPINPILDESVYCDVCEFNTKVRLNMVRHLQLHAQQQPAPNTAPVNPVPHLETNEKHFDKMVNLASSSITTRAPEKPAKETNTVMMSSDQAARYPQYVPERYRYTCGAQGCTYISVDEAMLRCHWETLHTGTNDYHCVHCPPYQHLDKSKPLSASRIIAHLTMHDIRLYACSACPYYHYRRPVLEKHVSETHKNATVVVVREEVSNTALTTPTPPAPTMDLKPWQCGLCKFKSMLRAEVVEHCSKMHQSKMQYKCAYCPFRTSVPENVTKHQTTSHPTREHEIFYFYYREGSIPPGPDGMPHWQKQRQKTGLDNVKAEADPPPASSSPPILPQPAPAVNLNLVKQEVPETQEIDPEAHSVLDSVEDLCRKYGEFCEPNGLNYKCSLCKVVVEDNKDAMQSHLYEELKYRKWGCRLCSYKAFHQPGLKEHMWTEHRQNQEPIELPVDVNVESWVSKLLDYQEDLIKKNRERLAQQKIQVERSTPSTSKTLDATSTPSNLTTPALILNFGSLGEPVSMQFSCPKCQFKSTDESQMKDHLELELHRIRWCCSICPNKFSTYHEAQFHCKSVHIGQNARPTEAARDPSIRSAWVAAVIRTQKQSMDCLPDTQRDENMSNDDENSLLMVRYEENVPTPEEETLTRKRPSTDSDDEENLVIDDQASKKHAICPHCDYATKWNHVLESHMLRHYNLRPYTCPYCDFNDYKTTVQNHMNVYHPGQPGTAKKTELPTGPPLVIDLPKPGKKIVPAKKPAPDNFLVCLVCEKLFTDAATKTHTHEGTVPMFAKRGDIVVKCCECLMLFLDVVGMQHHFTVSHPDLAINYAYYKTDQDTRGFIFCSHCNQRFTHIADLKNHHNLVHSSLKLKYTSKPYEPGPSGDNQDTTLPQRYANISSSGSSLSYSVAKKSTTKLPFFLDPEPIEEYSHYGKKPSSFEDLASVNVLVPFDKMVPFNQMT